MQAATFDDDWLNDIPEVDSEYETEDEVEVEEELPKEEQDSPTEELKKLNRHMGAIEGKVTNLSKRYDELKEEKYMEEMVQTPAAEAASYTDDPKTSEKINRFASMLKTL